MTEADEAAALLTFPKQRFTEQPEESIDTRELQFRKIHPDRNDAYKKWLRFQLCAIKDLIDSRTTQPHICWSPAKDQFNRYLSDPAHTGKAYSGKLKRNDSGCFPLCRIAHNLQEDRMNDFDQRYGIDRFAIAEEHFARFLESTRLAR